MAKSNIKAVLDVSRSRPAKTIIAKQLDIDSRFLKAAICDSGKPIKIPQSATVFLNVQRSDGLKNAFSCQISPNGTVTAPLHPWMLEIAGDCICDISIYGADNTKLTTTSFIVSVEENILDPDELEDDDNYSVLVDIIYTMQSLKSELQSSQTAIAQAESNRVSAESERQISFGSAVRNCNIAAATANAAAAAAENINISAKPLPSGMEVTVTDRYGAEKTMSISISAGSGNSSNLTATSDGNGNVILTVV